MDQARLTVIRRPELPGLEAVRGLGVAAGIVRHAHARLVVGLCQSGGRRIEAAGARWTVGPGEGFVIPAGLAHACSPLQPGGQGYLALAVAPCLLPPPGPQAAASLLPRVWRDAAMAARLSRLVDDLAAGREAVLAGLAELAAALGLRAGPPHTFHPATAAAKAAIDAAPHAPFRLAELARGAGVGPFRLERLFRRDLGLPPGEYLLSRRVALAAARIGAGASLAEAALAAGFCDQSHLTRQFRRRMGVSPGRFGCEGEEGKG
ncbi:MAG: helix-turn-helix domain-containing protein [Solidesulfovibrio sp. DCME]|uniref:helix-turn-helix domain-containing protein n=1 Tax=Solidesulfovibrio sp. DCME TaxID=3447380 RepID=UPI003D0BC5DB